MSNGAHMDERSSRVADWLRIPVLLAALAVIPVIVLQESNLGEPWKTVGAIGNWLVWVIFALELGIMLAVVPSRRQWLRENPFALPLVLLTPPFAPATLQSARAFRLLQLLRLARSFRLLRRYFSLEGLRFVSVVMLFVVVAGGTAFTAVEKGHQRGDLSPWDGVWWAITEVTTSNSSVNPNTDAGRIIAIVVLVVGLGFVAMLTAGLAQAFLSRSIEEQVEEAVDEAVEDAFAAAGGVAVRGDAEVLARLSEIAGRLDRIEGRLAPGADP
jgi:voltage-gated potassium channel